MTSMHRRAFLALLAAGIAAAAQPAVRLYRPGTS